MNFFEGGALKDCYFVLQLFIPFRWKIHSIHHSVQDIEIQPRRPASTYTPLPTHANKQLDGLPVFGPDAHRRPRHIVRSQTKSG